jgi:hypothetical protein
MVSFPRAPGNVRISDPLAHLANLGSSPEQPFNRLSLFHLKELYVQIDTDITACTNVPVGTYLSMFQLEHSA